MKILCIGFGSIAKRHIRNLKSVFNNNISIDVLRSGKGKPILDEFNYYINRIIMTDEEFEDLYYDSIFITNPTFLHYDSLMKYHDMSDAFFVEKPVFITGNEDISGLLDSKSYYVACPLRYTNVIQWLKNNVDFSKAYSIRAISSSHLPDWRPGTDYTASYSAHKDMGGGVSIDLIHEWDYITYLIGFPNSVKSIITKKSNLEIDSDDIAIYIAEYPSKVVEVHLDYFGRKPLRRLELYTEEDTIIADLIDQKISWLKSGRVLDLSEERDSYQKKELKHFLDIASGRIESDNTIEEACRVLRLARGVE